MILQNIQYPEAGINERSMYYRWSDGQCRATADKNHLIASKGCTLHFNTYFNSFSYGKWKKYTILGDLRLRLMLKGSLEVLLIRNDSAGEGFEEYILYRQQVVSDDLQEFEFIYPPTAEKGIVGFKIVTFDNCEIQGGCYWSGIDENSIEEVNLALCICTYKRENYVTANMEMLKTTVFSDKTSMLNGHLRVYIADNGQTLKPDKSGTDKIKIYSNMNTGGSGGFSRAMIEAISERKKYGLTHIILMDDDVIFTHHALERAYAFLKLLKPNGKNIMLGGAMLRLDLPFAQFANGETWNANGIIFNKVNYNLYELKYILRNEIEESINQLAWWFCCFPLDDNSKNNLALPVFFQYDDIDFSQRNSHLQKVTLNGVCLWHEAFEKKFSVSKEYYAMRNRLIISSIHGGNGFTKKSVKKLVRAAVIKNLMMYRYRAADLILRAVIDFFKGFEWLVSVNQEELNNEITAFGYKMQSLDELPIGFEYNRYAASFEYNESKIKRLFRLITLNGYMLRANRYSALVPMASDSKSNYFRVKLAMNYDENIQKGFVVEKSYSEAWRVLRRLRSLMRLVDRKFNKTAEMYRNNCGKYITQDFWREKLGLTNKIKKSPSNTLYVCSTYYHVFVTLIKTLLSRKTIDLVLTEYISGAEKLFERISSMNTFNNVIVLSSPKEYLPKHKLFMRFFNKKLLESQVDFNFKAYKDIYIFHDDTWFAHYFKDFNIDYHLIEDALDTFKIIDKTNFKYMIPPRRISLLKRGYKYFSDCKNIQSVEVNNLSGLKIPIDKRFFECPRNELINSLTAQDKKILLEAFSYETLGLEKIVFVKSKKLLFLTQPLVVDGYVKNKTALLKIYFKMITKYKERGFKYIVLKPHPRDFTDYSSLINEVIIIEKNFPAEILDFIDGLEFDLAVGYNSCALAALQCVKNIEYYNIN